MNTTRQPYSTAPSRSRTRNSVRNSAVAMTYFLVMLGLEFFSRKVFLTHLGEDILGLNSTAANLLQTLNLAELGIGAAIGFSLYRPLADGDYRQISAIMSLQGRIYRRIALAVGCGAIVLMGFFPVIFSDITLPLWYAYASFGVMLWSALLSYFVNYRQVLLTADQKDYRICLSYRSAMIAKTITQMWAVSRLTDGYIWWLILEGVFAAVGAWAVDLAVRRTFPHVKPSSESFSTLRRRFPEIEQKVKQVFFHKIAGFALEHGTPLVIYAFGSLAAVTAYINYYIIIRGGERMMAALFDPVTPGIGNLVTEGDRSKIRSVYAELFSARFYISATLVTAIYFLAHPFVSLWIGPAYLLPQTTLALMCAIMFIGLTRFATDSFRYAFGLFADTGAPVAETVASLTLSTLLGSHYGLDGILTGIVITQTAVIVIWKPYYLISRRMPGFGATYVRLYLSHLAAGAITAAAVDTALTHTSAGLRLTEIASLSAAGFAMAAAVTTATTAIILAVIMTACFKPFRRFAARIKHHYRP
ncbi:sugar transporter [Paramuribaculum intestinale]|uniref:lipopolysaccharide biosynthesis protein n=1 Tax=Paramuribaculum intestinale TaxID=2094151 RepID=UPI0025A58CED|nr:sugar transporter [Paramuribaculum intestinale]